MKDLVAWWRVSIGESMGSAVKILAMRTSDEDGRGEFDIIFEPI